MALQITEFQGVFTVHGKLNAGNIQIFKRHMQPYVTPKNKVVLNLQYALDVDLTAAKEMLQLYLEANRLKCGLSFFGLRNKHIIGTITKAKISHISSDLR